MIVEQCLAETGMSMWLIVMIAVMAIAVGAALLYKPLRQKLGLLTILFALTSTFSYATPTFAATNSCTNETSQAPGTTPASPTPTNPNPATPNCVVTDTESCSDPQLRSDEQGRLVACNADSTNEVDQWTTKVHRPSASWNESWTTPENTDIDNDTPGVQHTLDKPERGFRAVYDPATDNLTVTITNASLYPPPPAACGPCETSAAPALFLVQWRDGTANSAGYDVLSDGCNSGTGSSGT